MTIWDEQIRFVGIGAMVVAGVWSIIKIAGSMGDALRTALRGVRGLEDTASLPRTEQGITGRTLFLLLLASLLLSAVVYYLMTGSGMTTLADVDRHVRPGVLLRRGGELHRRSRRSVEQPGVRNDDLYGADHGGTAAGAGLLGTRGHAGHTRRGGRGVLRRVHVRGHLPGSQDRTDRRGHAAQPAAGRGARRDRARADHRADDAAAEQRVRDRRAGARGCGRRSRRRRA